MKYVRISTKFKNQKRLWRILLDSTLEQKMLMPAVQLVACFLGLEPISKVKSSSLNAYKARSPQAEKLSPSIMEYDVIEPVHHRDPPAVISPQEAETFVHVQEAGFVE